jgi:hypothetical protein
MTLVTPENISTLVVGTMLSVPGRKTPVRVTEVNLDYGVTVCTTSGRVRPGAHSGGILSLLPGGGYYWQATIQQNAVYDPVVSIVGLAC